MKNVENSNKKELQNQCEIIPSGIILSSKFQLNQPALFLI